MEMEMGTEDLMKTMMKNNVEAELISKQLKEGMENEIIQYFPAEKEILFQSAKEGNIEKANQILTFISSKNLNIPPNISLFDCWHPSSGDPLLFSFLFIILFLIFNYFVNLIIN